MENLPLYIIVFVMTLVSLWITRYLALRNKWLAPVRKDRWHKKPTALFGGVGFYPVFFFSLLYIIYRSMNELNLLLALLIGSLVMFLLGWIDDCKNFRPITKLVVQVLAAIIFIATGGVFTLTEYFLINVLFTLIWFVGITNAINLLDNMDGLSSGVAILSATSLVLIAYSGSDVNPIIIPVGFSLAANLLAFWVYNKPPASIFMGDSGSLSIGYVLAALAIPTTLNNYWGIENKILLANPFLVVFVSIAILIVPIFDTAYVVITRKLRGRSIFLGGRDHISHRLASLGIGENKVIWILYALSISGGLVAFLMLEYKHLALLFCILLLLTLCIFGYYLSKITFPKT